MTEKLKGFWLPGETQESFNAGLARAKEADRISFGVINAQEHADPMQGVFFTARDEGLLAQLVHWFRSEGFRVEAAVMLDE